MLLDYLKKEREIEEKLKQVIQIKDGDNVELYKELCILAQETFEIKFL